MTRQTVFDYLRKVENANSTLDITGAVLHPERARGQIEDALVQVGPPTQDLTTAIYREVVERGKPLSQGERRVAQGYLVGDFLSARHYAHEGTKELDSQVPGSKEWYGAIETLVDLTERAQYDLNVLGMVTEPADDVYFLDTTEQEMLCGLQEDLSIMRAFPIKHKTILPLQQQLRRAIREERYEDAAKLRSKVTAAVKSVSTV